MWLARYVSFLRAWARARPGIFVDCAQLFTLLGWKWSARVHSTHGQAISTLLARKTARSPRKFLVARVPARAKN